MQIAFGRIRRRIAILRTETGNELPYYERMPPLRVLMFFGDNAGYTDAAPTGLNTESTHSASLKIKYAHFTSMAGGETLGETPKQKPPTRSISIRKLEN